MWSVGSGVWQARNAKIVGIKPNWSGSTWLNNKVLVLTRFDREIRKKCPNSMILRELDQLASSMK